MNAALPWVTAAAATIVAAWPVSAPLTVILIAAAAATRHHLTARRDTPLDLSHPAARRFTRGPMPAHDTTPLLPAEEEQWEALTAPLRAELPWVRPAAPSTTKENRDDR